MSSDRTEPYSVAAFTLDYRSEGFPLQTIAKRFIPRQSRQPNDANLDQCTLLLTSGIGLTSDLWIPTIKHLFKQQTHLSNPPIRSIWTIECPNHGDAAVLNEQFLHERYSEQFSLREYATSIFTLLSSDLLSDAEKSNLIAVGHCAGGAGLTAMAYTTPTLPFASLILIEPPWFAPNPYLQALFPELAKRIKAINDKRPRVWSSTEDAMKYFTSRPPWKTWCPDSLEIMRQTFFRPTSPSPQVTTKTPITQESATFAASSDLLSGSDLLAALIRTTPTHLIVGERQDFWPKPIYTLISDVLESNKPHLASITYLPDAGHHVPQEKPAELATTILHLLSSSKSSKSDAKL